MVIWYQWKIPESFGFGLFFPKFPELVGSWQIISLCREGFVSDPGSLRKKFVKVYKKENIYVASEKKCVFLLILKDSFCISKNMFCGFLLQISNVINTHIKGSFRTKFSVYLQQRAGERGRGEMESFLFLLIFCRNYAILLWHILRREGGSLKSNLKLGCLKQWTCRCEMWYVHFSFAQSNQIKLNQISALLPTVHISSRISHIFGTDLQMSPFSDPRLFDRQACAKLWIHIYIWIFLKYSNPSFISSFHIHHKIRQSQMISIHEQQVW